MSRRNTDPLAHRLSGGTPSMAAYRLFTSGKPLRVSTFEEVANEGEWYRAMAEVKGRNASDDEIRELSRAFWRENEVIQASAEDEGPAESEAIPPLVVEQDQERQLAPSIRSGAVRPAGSPPKAPCVPSC